MLTHKGSSSTAGRGPLRSEAGFAMVATLLVMVLIGALASTALLRARMDLTVAGNYKAQRAAEATADAGVELTKAMIYGNEALLTLPLSIPSTDAAARAWQAGGAGGVTYTDADMSLKLYVTYKQEDNINYNATEAYADEVVRYGKDYNYSGAKKTVGKQPVYTLTVEDLKTHTKSETDLLAAMGFRTPAAIFTKGSVKMYKWGNACQERIEVTSGPGTAALATTLSKSNANVFIQTATDLAYDNGGGTSYTSTPNRVNPTNHLDLFHNSAASPPWGNLASCYTHFAYRDQGGGVGYYDRDSQYYASTVNSAAQHVNHGATAPIAAPFAPYLADDVYTATENTNDYNAGRRNLARNHQFILLGVGDKTLDLDAAASAAAAKAIFNFDQDDLAVVQYNYTMPGDGKLETMMGATFADFQSVADRVLPDASIPVATDTVPDDFGGTLSSNRVLDLSNVSFGTADFPQVVFVNSNMNLDGTSNGQTAVGLKTDASTQMQGYGILIINGDVKVYGSINWKGLMIVRGDLFFRPWQGGNWCNRSDSTLASNWDGMIMVGGDLDLLALAGGTILLGYGGPGSSAAEVKGLISAAIEQKTLSWRRSYR